MMAIIFAISSSSLFAQDYKDNLKERKATQKLTKAELNEKASKAAKKAAKEYTKEGWQVAPGQLPLEKQLDRTYLMQYEFDENMLPKYIMSEAMSIGQNYDAAKIQAMELAKMNLAGLLQTQIAALTESTVANEQLTSEQAVSITKSVTASKSAISQKLGRVITVIECYRTLSNKNKEVRIQIAYNQQMAFEAAAAVIKQDLEQQGINLHNELNKMLNIGK